MDRLSVNTCVLLKQMDQVGSHTYLFKIQTLDMIQPVGSIFENNVI